MLDRATGRVEVTAHNHGFAVDAPLDGPADTDFGRVEVSHVGLNDGVVEGLRCLDVPAFSVQYHPEAAAGPHDAGYLFDRFVDLMSTSQPPIKEKLRIKEKLAIKEVTKNSLDRREFHDRQPFP